MNLRILVIFSALLFGAIPTAGARVVAEDFTLSTLFQKAEFIVVAYPLTKTIDTNERGFFPYLQDGVTGQKEPAIGVETLFKVVYVLKGDRRVKQFLLHHYREPDHPGKIIVDGPGTVFFDPDDKERGSYLMFLTKERDGRYAPYGDRKFAPYAGQTDPNDITIIALTEPRAEEASNHH